VVLKLGAPVFVVGALISGAAWALTPEPLAPSNETWNSPQFVVSDRQGRAFLLRSDTLDVYGIRPDGTLEQASRLAALASAGDDPFIRDAALSPSGSDWLLLDVAIGPRFFDSGKEVALPALDWQAVAVALPQGDLMVQALPFRRAAENDISPRADGSWGVFAGTLDPPLLMRHGSDGWSVVARQPVTLSSSDSRQGVARAKFEAQGRLAADPKGNVVVADELGYRVRKLAPSGKLLAEIRVGKGTVEWKERSPAEIEAVGREIEKQSGARPGGDSLRFESSRVIDGVAVAADGLVYLLVEAPAAAGETALALDRIDLTAERLDRVFLGGRLGVGMRYSMAAAKHGLYLAAFSGKGGRWVLPWDLLETAAWKGVKDATLDGQPMNQR
jgi:hypothetical protein